MYVVVIASHSSVGRPTVVLRHSACSFFMLHRFQFYRCRGKTKPLGMPMQASIFGACASQDKLGGLRQEGHLALKTGG